MTSQDPRMPGGSKVIPDECPKCGAGAGPTSTYLWKNIHHVSAKTKRRLFRENVFTPEHIAAQCSRCDAQLQFPTMQQRKVMADFLELVEGVKTFAARLSGKEPAK